MGDLQCTQLNRYVRRLQLEKFGRFLNSKTRTRTRLNYNDEDHPLKVFVRKLRLEKLALLRNPKRSRFLRFNTEMRRTTRRMIVNYCNEGAHSKRKPLPYSNILVPRTSYQYKPIDGYKYGIVFWLRRGDENGNENDVANYHEDSDNNEELTYMTYKVTLKFMCGLRNGLSIQLRSKPWDIPFNFASTYNAKTIKNYIDNSIPIGLAALVVGLGIPETCREAMFRDISRFTPPHLASSSCNVVTLCMEIQITTLQLEGEDLLETHLRADLNRIHRSKYIDLNILGNEANLEHFNMNLFFGEDQQEEDCCSICLEELRGVACSELPYCFHIYHYDCIYKWISRYNFCPLCRHPYQRLFHPYQSLFHSYQSRVYLTDEIQ